MFRFLRHLRPAGEAIVVVSGLPRSGTSMLMNMLQAGGLPLLTDQQRTADTDNPNGYFEFDPVRMLAEQRDKSWLRQARGKGLKVISHLLKELPPGNRYRIVLIRRDLAEVVRSQNTMLQHRGEPNAADDERTRALYLRHLVNVRVLARQRADFDLLEVAYAAALDSPQTVAANINRFLGGKLDEMRMADVVDRKLYRNREGLITEATS